MAPIVLIIDPDQLERRRLQRAFAEAGLDLVEAGSAIEGLFEALERDPVLILLAEQVPPLAAGELLLVLRRITDAPIIVIGNGDEPEEASALDLGADFYLRRPFGAQVAVARARALLRRHRGSALGAAGGAGVPVLSRTGRERRGLARPMALVGPVSMSHLVKRTYGEGRPRKMPDEGGLRPLSPWRADHLPATNYAGSLRQAAS